jgi:signal transduction histidine kinase
MSRAGGFLEVDSRPGRGTTFVVRLRGAADRPVAVEAERPRGDLAS